MNSGPQGLYLLSHLPSPLRTILCQCDQTAEQKQLSWRKVATDSWFFSRQSILEKKALRQEFIGPGNKETGILALSWQYPRPYYDTPPHSESVLATSYIDTPTDLPH